MVGGRCLVVVACCWLLVVCCLLLIACCLLLVVGLVVLLCCCVVAVVVVAVVVVGCWFGLVGWCVCCSCSCVVVGDVLLVLLLLCQTRALMCDVYVHNDKAMQRQSLRLTGGKSLGSQDSHRPRLLSPVSNTGKTVLKQNSNSEQRAARYARLVEIMPRFQSEAAGAIWSIDCAHFSTKAKNQGPKRAGRKSSSGFEIFFTKETFQQQQELTRNMYALLNKHCAMKSTPKQRT